MIAIASSSQSSGSSSRASVTYHRSSLYYGRSSHTAGGWTGAMPSIHRTEEDPDSCILPNNESETEGPALTAMEMAENERRHNEDSEDIDQLRKILDSNNRSYLKGLLRDRHYPAQRTAVRQYLWKRMLKVLAGNREADIYQEMKKELYPDGPHEGVAGSLPPFVDLNHVSTLPYASRVQLSHANCLLHMLAESRPDITYSPLLLPLLLLFLKSLAEEDAFDLLYAIVVDRVHARLPQTMTACHVQACVLERLTSKYLKPFYAALVQEMKASSGNNVSLKRPGDSGSLPLPLHHVFIDWHWWIFEYLPVDYTLVIVDSYLAEGIKLLFRAALALLSLYSRVNIKNKEALRNFPDTMREFCKKFDHDVDRFYKVMLSFRAFSGARIEKYFRVYEQEVSKRDLTAEIASASAKGGSAPAAAVATTTGTGTDGTQPSQNVRSTFLNLLPPVNSTLSRDNLMTIYGWLPARIQLTKPLLVFTTAIDGTSLGTFYSRCDQYEPILLIVKTVGNPSRLFGAYCSTAWAGRAACPGSFFGTGESFLFQLTAGGVAAKRYPWVGEGRVESSGQLSHMFQMGAEHQLQVGGGSGAGLSLSDPLTSGYSERCETFDNKPLAGETLRDFECHTVEAYAFQP